jgi:hypothetical protein
MESPMLLFANPTDGKAITLYFLTANKDNSVDSIGPPKPHS